MEEVGEYYRFNKMKQAVDLKKKYGDEALVVAGGTIATQLITRFGLRPKAILSLENLPLNYVKITRAGVEIGATTTVSNLLSIKNLPTALVQAARGIHGLALKEMATIGGNIFSPAPAGDLATALLALDADLLLVRTGGKRIVPLNKFYKGSLTYNMRRDEILYAIRISKVPKLSAFLKLTPYAYSGPTICSAAVGMDLSDGKVVRLAISVGGLTTHPYRATVAEKMLKGKLLTEAIIDEAVARVTDGIQPSDDGFYSAEYKSKVAQVLVRKILYKLAGLNGR